MSTKATGFLTINRSTPVARAAKERIADSHEFEGKLTGKPLKQQATRCMDCGVPFCHQGCPLGNLIPEFNELVRVGKMSEAAQRLASTNNFPEVTGRVCPAPCEAACVLAINSEPVTIKHLEKAIAAEEDFAPQPPRIERGERIAIVGSGPAGLAAAQQLRRAGYGVTVFERSDKIGGLLRYGIPDFKLDKRLLDSRVQQLRLEGVRFVTGVEVGVDITLEKLERDHAAVGLAIGAPKPRDVQVPGRELQGVHFAMDYLTAANRAVSDGVPSALSAAGQHVVILGGGDTGADCVGTAHRQGAASVTQLEIMPRPAATRPAANPWPEWPLVFRTSASHEEGGAREFAVQTQAFVGTTHVESLELCEVEWRDGVPVPQSVTRRIPATLVLIAAGFVGVEAEPWKQKLPMTPRGTLTAAPDFSTPRHKVFACGDATRGASLVVWAIAEGRQMAKSIERWLTVPGARYVTAPDAWNAPSAVATEAQPNLR